MKRWMAGGLIFAAVTMVPPGLSAQLTASRSYDRVLVMPPVPGNAAESTYAVTLAAAIRDRLESKYRYKMVVVPSNLICETIQASGFSCGAPLPPSTVKDLARFMQVNAYVVGSLKKGADSSDLALRLVPVSGSGLSGWVHVIGPTNDAEKIANQVADKFDDQIKAAQYAKECDDRRGRSDFKGARDRAKKAFELFPNQPQAALCLALVFEATKAPGDSVIWALEKATRGDSLNGSTWEMLGRQYRSAGDSAKALNAFIQQLNADPTNLALRNALAAQYMQENQYQKAVDLLDYELHRNPLDLPTLRLKQQACVDGQLWGCALSSLSALSEVDSSLATDSIFYGKIFGAAQSLDSVPAMLKWSKAAVDHFPNSLTMWRARSAAFKAAHDRAGQIDAYNHIVGLDSTQVSYALQLAQYLLDSTLVIDSTTPLDTARLAKADTLLQLVARQAHDTATQMNVAALYFAPGARLVQARVHYPLAVTWLQNAIDHDLLKRVTAQANFFMGLAYFFQVLPISAQIQQVAKIKKRSAAQDADACSLVATEADLLQKAKDALENGKAVSPPTYGRIMPYILQIQKAIPSYKPYFKCKS